MRFLFNSLQSVAFVLFLCTLLAICVQTEGGRDDEFARHLEKVMRNYTMWLKENNLDPSPPIKNAMRYGNWHGVTIRLNCELSNHYVVGISELSVATNTSSNFSGHAFTVDRTIIGLYESHGQFNCDGVMLHQYFPELIQDLPFSGHGTFLITTNYSTDFLTMSNVGITQDYKLDMSESWPYYTLIANQKYIGLTGEFSDPRIAEKYSANFQSQFAWVYKLYPHYSDDQPSFPSARLLERYLRERMQGFDLRETLDDDNLPNPYIPVTTTTRAPLPDAGEKIFVEKAAIICFQAVLLFWYY